MTGSGASVRRVAADGSRQELRQGTVEQGSVAGVEETDLGEGGDVSSRLRRHHLRHHRHRPR